MTASRQDTEIKKKKKFLHNISKKGAGVLPIWVCKDKDGTCDQKNLLLLYVLLFVLKDCKQDRYKFYSSHTAPLNMNIVIYKHTKILLFMNMELSIIYLNIWK